jgi:hypothetical protein
MPSENILITCVKTWRIVRLAMPVHATFHGFNGIFVINRDEALRASVAQWIGHQKRTGPKDRPCQVGEFSLAHFERVASRKAFTASNTHGAAVACLPPTQEQELVNYDC